MTGFVLKECPLVFRGHHRDMSQTFSLGSLCDEVLLAIYERERGPLGESSLRKIEEAASWFVGLSVLLADPLSLSESLPHVSKLDVTKYLFARGTSLDYILSPIAPKGSVIGSSADTRGVLAKRMSQLLRALGDNEIEESDVRSVQEALANLARQLVPTGRMAYS